MSLAETISALSFALDLTEDAVPGHALRSCLIGMRIGEQLGLSEHQRFSLFYALLLKDVGCSSNSARMCQIIGGGDDRAVKAGVKFEDWTRPHQPKLSAIRLLWKNVSPGAGKLARAWQIGKIAATQHANNAQMIALRCDRGASIVRQLGVGNEAAEAVRSLDEHWDGSGYPERLVGESVPLLARIACVAQHLDVFATGQSPDLAIATLNARSSRWFDPELVRIANILHRNGRLWMESGDAYARQAVLDLAPSEGRELTAAGIDNVCQAFADVVDAKSPFTFRHSVGVTTIAQNIARHMGLSADRARLVYRGALLHDLGKLRVPNSILDMNGRPNDEEWRVIREHPALTRRILGRVHAFTDLARVAGAHHEKLDGSGYPDRLNAKDIPLEARILTVADIYGALTEDRPYRSGSPAQEALAIMRRDAPHKLDSDCLDALVAVVQNESRQVAPVAAPVSTRAMAYA